MACSVLNMAFGTVCLSQVREDKASYGQCSQLSGSYRSSAHCRIWPQECKLLLTKKQIILEYTENVSLGFVARMHTYTDSLTYSLKNIPSCTEST